MRTSCRLSQLWNLWEVKWYKLFENYTKMTLHLYLRKVILWCYDVWKYFFTACKETYISHGRVLPCRIQTDVVCFGTSIKLTVQLASKQFNSLVTCKSSVNQLRHLQNYRHYKNVLEKLQYFLTWDELPKTTPLF